MVKTSKYGPLIKGMIPLLKEQCFLQALLMLKCNQQETAEFPLISSELHRLTDDNNKQ